MGTHPGQEVCLKSAACSRACACIIAAAGEGGGHRPQRLGTAHLPPLALGCNLHTAGCTRLWVAVHTRPLLLLLLRTPGLVERHPLLFLLALALGLLGGLLVHHASCLLRRRQRRIQVLLDRRQGVG